MKINANSRLDGLKVVLIPYNKDHVPKYHNWMEDEELREQTASERLTLEEEYQMQESWRNDADKCTFIILDKDIFEKTNNDIDSMVGDVNLFFNDIDDRNSAEVEVMIAERNVRGRGYGKEAVVLMLIYGIRRLNVRKYSVKIGQENVKSIRLFEKLGFVLVGKSDVFREVELRLDVNSEMENILKELCQLNHLSCEPSSFK
ncbi:DgyrCDS3544 [Dimorphilus gyrociliatus]|uniref:N-acetyltransferase 9-like protein n=1 Tax=Dimorphilus gyrociliatus TaxID=2664684 RepID=A0A7I8VDK2_9ANNE|nr:DgyrCDS3544 [Dimorphilus gyrociliatus]